MTEFHRTEPAKTWVAPGIAVAAAMLREAETWASTQGELLSGVEAIWCDWMKRQSEAIDAGSRSLRQMFDCRNPAELVQLQQQWVADTLRRTAADIGSLTTGALAVSRRAAGGAERFAAAAAGSRMARDTAAATTSDTGPLQRAAAE